jgi:hypothetical protein
MSAIDIIRSFAESSESDDAKATVIITRGGLRELVSMHEAAKRIIAAQPQALALLGAKMAEKDAEIERLTRVIAGMDVEVNGAMRDFDNAKAEIARLSERLRSTAQILVCKVGADGPMDAEEAARRAVAELARLREENEELTMERDRSHEREAVLLRRPLDGDAVEFARLRSLLKGALVPCPACDGSKVERVGLLTWECKRCAGDTPGYVPAPVQP